jgi:hypothetical protein
MSKMTEKDLRRRDAKRNIGEELLRAVQEMKAGRYPRCDPGSHLIICQFVIIFISRNF